MSRHEEYTFKKAGDGAYHVWCRGSYVWLGSACRSARGDWTLVDLNSRIVMVGFPGTRDMVGSMLRSHYERTGVPSRVRLVKKA